MSFRRLLRWPDGFIAVFVLVQLILPLHYYVLRQDEHDERFAWRMFSPTRMTTCEVSMTADGAPVVLDRWFAQAWTQTAARGRRGVVEAMGAHLCKRHKDVTARLSCKEIVAIDSLPPPQPPNLPRMAYYRGAPYPIGGSFNLCEIPRL